MNITLQQITPSNFEQVIALKVREDQDHVASNVYSIAEAKVCPDDIVMAIYNNDIPVGFVMYTPDYDDNCLWISRFMVDLNHQGLGYGTAALHLIKKIAQEDPKIKKLGLSTHKTNTEGIKFYTKFGFVDTGRTDNDPDNPEEIFELELEV